MVEQKQIKNFSGSEESSTTFGNSRSHGAQLLAAARPFHFPAVFTRSQRLTIEKRQHILNRVQKLKAAGMSESAAAQEVRVPLTTLWRWRKRIVPLTANCGVKSALAKFNPPAELLALVRQLQIGGKSNAAAWQEAANSPLCPPKLSSTLRAGHVAPSLLAATKLTRKKVTVLEAPGILVIKQ